MNYIYDPTSILDYISQPVLFVREGRILHTNQAATIYVQELTDAIDTLMSQDDVEAYHNFDGTATLEVILKLGGNQYGTTIHRQADWDVFIAYTTPLGQGHQASIMALTGQTMRGAMMDIFTGLKPLFAYLEESEDKELQDRAAQVNRGVCQLLRLASNLADGSLFLTQTRAISLCRIGIEPFFKELFKKIKGYCDEKRIAFEPSMQLRIAYANVDDVLIRRAILNVISNSLKFTHAGGKITMSVEAQNSTLKIQITDTGEGISEQVLGSVFERYTTRGLAGDGRWGVGLGLPMVRYIMKAHGGNVMISTEVGVGTTVVLTMPLYKTVSPTVLNSPIMRYDTTNGQDPFAVELADAMPVSVYKPNHLP